MRQVLHQDLIALARVLVLLPKNVRQERARRLIAFAHEADAWREKTGKAHPMFGDGTLQSACSSLPWGSEEFLEDIEYNNSLCVALMALVEL